MKILGIVLAAVVLVLPGLAAGEAVPLLPEPGGAVAPPSNVLAQGPGGFPPPMPGELRSGGPGAWWTDSEIAKKLGLSEAQVSRIEQTFLEHRFRLVDLRADLEKQELSLQPLLDVDRPDEAKVSAQIDLITAARGRLEKENALMLLAIRRVLSTEQWKQLQALQQGRARGSHAGPGFTPGRQYAPPPPR